MCFKIRYSKEITMELSQIQTIKPNTTAAASVTPTEYSALVEQINSMSDSLTALQTAYNGLSTEVDTSTIKSSSITNSGAVNTNSIIASSGNIDTLGISSVVESTPAITKTVTGTSIPVAVCNNPYFGAHILLGTQTIDFIYTAGTMIAQSSSGLADSIVITVNDNKYYICLQSSTGASSTLLQVWAYQSTLTATELNYSSSGGLFVSTTGNVAISGAITFDNATYSFQDLSVPGTLTAGTIKATNETISASTIGDLTATSLNSSTATLTTANITTANVVNETVTGDMSVARTITTPTISASTIGTNNMEVRGALVNGTSATLGVTSATSLDTGSISHKDKYITLPTLGSNTDYYVIALPIFEGRYEIKGVDTNGIEFDADFEMRKASAALPTIYVKYSTNYLIYFSNIQYYAGKLYIKTSLGNFKLYYYSDTEDAADAPMTYTNYYPYSTPVFSNDITYKAHELILGDGTTNYGLYANGEVAAVIVAQTGSSGSFDSIVVKDATIQNNLVVQKYLTDGAGSKGTASQTLKVDPVDGTTIWTTDKDLTIATTNTLANVTTSATYNSNIATTVNTYIPDQEVNKADEVTFAKVTAPVVGNVTGDLTGNINKTQGILYNSADDTTTALANGTAGQTLTINEDGTAPIWKTPTTLSTSVSGGTASSFLYRESANTTKFLQEYTYICDSDAKLAQWHSDVQSTTWTSGNDYTKVLIVGSLSLTVAASSKAFDLTNGGTVEVDGAPNASITLTMPNSSQYIFYMDSSTPTGTI